MSEWNAYYDVYVKLAALLLVFMVSCNYVTDPQFWLHLKAGQLIAEHKVADQDRCFLLHGTRPGLDRYPLAFPVGKRRHLQAGQRVWCRSTRRTHANRASAEQIAVGSLVVVSALIRLATAWLLLMIRRPGPGLWWSAVVVTLCLGAVFNPMYGLIMGGIASVATVLPQTWGLMFFAFEMFLLYRAFFLGRPRALWLLVPTFVLWANIDPSFFTGLLVLAAAGVGRWLDGKIRVRPGRSSGKVGQAIRRYRRRTLTPESSAARPRVRVCHPGGTAPGLPGQPVYLPGLRGCGLSLSPAIPAADQDHDVSICCRSSGRGFATTRAPDWYLLPAFYIAVVVLGLASFFLNFRRFSWARFLPFAVISVIWGIFMYANPMFAVVFAAVVGPNGQEWYHDKFGTEGRLGRIVDGLVNGGPTGHTRVLVFLVVGLDITGWKNTLHEVQFGLRLQPGRFHLRGGRVSGEQQRHPGESPQHVDGPGRRLDLEGCAAKSRRTSTADRVSSRRNCSCSGKRRARRSAMTRSRNGSRCSTSIGSARS